MSVEVPSVSFWSAAGVAIAGAFGWLLRLDRRQRAFLTAAQHEKICQGRDQELGRRFDEIKELLEQERDANAQRERDSREYRERIEKDEREYRDRVANALHSQGLGIAVIQTELRLRQQESVR